MDPIPIFCQDTHALCSSTVHHPRKLQMGRARLPSRYAKVQLGLHALALGAALATIAAGLYVASLGFGFGSEISLGIVAVSLN